MINIETAGFVIACCTLAATIAACIIASRISKKTARYSVFHFINKKGLRLIHLMNEHLQLSIHNEEISDQLKERLFYDNVEIHNICMSIGLESISPNFLKKRQKTAIIEIQEAAARYLNDSIENKSKSIGDVYLALCNFNGYKKRDIERLKQLDKMMKGGNFDE